MVRELLKELVVNFQSKDKRTRKGIFFVVSGPSGVGKNTLLNYALGRVEGIYYLPSITTRSMRPGEVQGFPYFFVSKAEFEGMITQGAFLEWKQIHTGDYYGTHLPTIVYALENGYDIVTDMDVLGCAEVMERFPGNVVPIFIVPPNMEALRRRLAGREKDPALIARRMARVDMEMGFIDRYRHVIVNDDLERAGKELVRILEQYSQRD
ncbi:guanylate kinase [Moorella sulfitireducens (nom. illeg.)]|uniref:guanylate kinase n=1 Tax=Neomoorella sulfitireducens TaxID=2972948 RepID=UPI0021AD0BD8|nr:guanylate kinase [Moorella sulfitireducens]